MDGSAARVRPLAAALVVVAILAGSAQAQGLPFTTPTALPLPLAENGLRAFYQHLEARTLLQNGDPIANPENLRVGVDAVPLIVPVGVTPHTVLMAVLPYLHKTFESNGATATKSGVGDVTVLVRQDVLARDVVAGNRRLALIAGASFPTGATGDSAAALAPPLRLGLGTTNLTGQAVYSYVNDRIGVHTAVGYTAAAGSTFGVRTGDRFSYDVALGLRLAPVRYRTLRDVTGAAYLELLGTVEQPAIQNGTPLANTGGHTLWLAPGLQLLPRQNWALETSFQVPVVRQLHGTQLAPTWSLAVGARAVLYLFGG